MQTKQVKISDLKFAEYNPRQISNDDMASLVNSIREFGCVQLVVVNKDNTVIGGHQTISACRQLSYETVPVFYVDLSKKKEKILNLALNRIHGDWNIEKLSIVLEELKMDNGDEIYLTGFSEIELGEVSDIHIQIKQEDLRPIKKAHILISMTTDSMIDLLPKIEMLIKESGAEIHYAGN